MMFRTIKALNNNGLLAVSEDGHTEVIVLGKGVGFGKKASERFEPGAEDRVYVLREQTDRGASHSLALSLDPAYIEVTNELLRHAETTLGELEEDVLLPLADHIAFAVRRMEKNGSFDNPMAPDIRALFPEEFAAAEYVVGPVRERFGVELNEDELSFIALHLHGARDRQKVSAVMEDTQMIHDALGRIQEGMHFSFDPSALAYNRLLSHMKYMLVRMRKGERINLNLNQYISHDYPETYTLAESICNKISTASKLPCLPEETGYLAVHIERICRGNEEGR